MMETARELARIADQLERSARGQAWHGPSVEEVLRDVDEQQAQSKVISGRHSAWEILVHMTAWTRAARRALEGMPLQLSDREDWPSVDDTSSAAWERDRAGYYRETDLLLASLAEHADQLLQQTVPGRDYDFYYLLHGVVQHNLYHAGQIRLLTM